LLVLFVIAVPAPFRAWARGTPPNRDAGAPLEAPQLDGTWTPLGTALNNKAVSSVLFQDGDVYAAGNFWFRNSALGLDYIARFRQGQWTTVGGGLNYPVFDLAHYGKQIIAAGIFTNAGGNPISDKIAGYDPATNSWSPVGQGLNESVLSIAVRGDELIAGGRFTNAGQDPNADKIAKFNFKTGTWSALGGGLEQYFSNSYTVYSVAVSGKDVYAVVDEYPGYTYVAKFSNGTWSFVGDKFLYNVHGLAVFEGIPYIVGEFEGTLEDPNALSFARFKDGAWQAVPGYVEQETRPVAFALRGSKLYVAGEDDLETGPFENSPGIAIFDLETETWMPVGNGINGEIWDMAQDGDNLYLVGDLKALGANSNRNSVVRFTPTCNTVPTRPSPTSPANASTGSATRPKLNWGPAICADTYTVTIKDASTNQVVQKHKGLSKLKLQVDALTPGKTYKWFVQAVNPHGKTKSQVRSLTITP
jgi:hypothetical protein